jgi:hypothetical protein
MGDDFTELRGRLRLRLGKIKERIFKAFVARDFSGAEEIQVLQSNDLVHFPEIEQDLDELLDYLQHLRSTYSLPRLGLRHDDSWRVQQSDGANGASG